MDRLALDVLIKDSNLLRQKNFFFCYPISSNIRRPLFSSSFAGINWAYGQKKRGETANQKLIMSIFLSLCWTHCFACGLHEYPSHIKLNWRWSGIIWQQTCNIAETVIIKWYFKYRQGIHCLPSFIQSWLTMFLSHCCAACAVHTEILLFFCFWFCHRWCCCLHPALFFWKQNHTHNYAIYHRSMKHWPLSSLLSQFAWPTGHSRKKKLKKKTGIQIYEP